MRSVVQAAPTLALPPGAQDEFFPGASASRRPAGSDPGGAHDASLPEDVSCRAESSSPLSTHGQPLLPALGACVAGFPAASALQPIARLSWRRPRPARTRRADVGPRPVLPPAGVGPAGFRPVPGWPGEHGRRSRAIPRPLAGDDRERSGKRRTAHPPHRHARPSFPRQEDHLAFPFSPGNSPDASGSGRYSHSRLAT